MKEKLDILSSEFYRDQYLILINTTFKNHGKRNYTYYMEDKWKFN